MRLKFGIGFLPGDFQTTADQARVADEAGFDLIRVADSQCLYRDLYVTLTVVALNTKRALVGPGVTPPSTRHPTITAGAIASIDELSGGRAILGIGAGDSAVLNIGERPASVQTLREYITAIRELFRNRETVYRGKTIRLTWPAREVPIWLAAAGPKTLRLAGELADVVVMGCGFLPECIQESLAYVEEGARAAGRSREDFEVWAYGPGNVADSREEALAPLLAGSAATGHLSFPPGFKQKSVPPALLPSLRKMAEEYETHHHQHRGGRNAELIEKLGLTDYMGRRFTLSGTAEECIAQVRAAAGAGAQGFMLTIITPEPLKTIRDLGEKVVAEFQ